MRRSREGRKEYLVMLLGGECFRCGFSGHISAFDFHHKFPKDKLYNVAQGLKINSDDFENNIVPEVKEKCILLCSNCHRIIHADRRERADLVHKIKAKEYRSKQRRQKMIDRGLLITGETSEFIGGNTGDILSGYSGKNETSSESAGNVCPA